MSPLYADGDFLLLSCWHKSYHQGQKIVFLHPELGLMVKQIKAIQAQAYQVQGLHPESSSSESLGLIQSTWILGRVIWHIKGKN